MPDDHEELLQLLRDAGVDNSITERLDGMISASPIRKERDEARKRAEAAEAEAARFRGMAVGATFKEVGIVGNPGRFNIPADLDITDVGAVRDWAVEGGLVEPPPPTTPIDEQATHDRMAGASDGATPPAAQSLRDKILESKDPREVRSLMKEQGFLT